MLFNEKQTVQHLQPIANHRVPAVDTQSSTRIVHVNCSVFKSAAQRSCFIDFDINQLWRTVKFITTFILKVFFYLLMFSHKVDDKVRELNFPLYLSRLFSYRPSR